MDKPRKNFRVLVFYVLLFLSFLLFETFWVDILNKVWVNPVMSRMNKYEALWITCFILLIIFYYLKAFKYERLVNRKRMMLLGTFSIIYLICFFSGNWIYYQPYDCRLLSYANISLVPFFAECILFIKIKCRQKNQEIQPELEIENIENVDDSYQRNSMISTVAEMINQNFHETQSFAIGISGAWGSGKTTFLNGLKRALKDLDENDKTAFLLFEPWKNESPDSIIKSFFDLYKGEISKYAPQLSPVINEYVLKLLNEEGSTIVKVCSQISEIFLKSEKDKDLYEDIKECLKKIVHKTIIFIDDIDRLSAPEIIEVLRLIRNTANFPYLQFIVTYDKEYLIKILDGSGVPKPEEYLEKIFNLEIPLPKFEERVICNELHTRIMETLNNLFQIDKDNVIYKDMVFHRCSEESPTFFDYLIPKILKNNRDVIRFHNSFKIVLNCFRDNHQEIDYRDLFYLELLRYRFSEVYDILRNTPLVLMTVTGEYYLPNTIKNSQLKEEDKPSNTQVYDPLRYYSTSDQEIINTLMNLLFYTKIDENGMAYVRNYGKYFMFRLDEKILTQSELLALAEKNDTGLLGKAEIYYKSKNLSEFENQLSNTLASIKLEDYTEKETNSLQKRYNLDFSKLYRMIHILSRSKYRGLRDEVVDATIPYIQSLRVYSLEQLRALLDILNHINIMSPGAIKLNMDDFLMSILYKENLSAKLYVDINDEVIEIIRSFLKSSKWNNLISPGVSDLIDSHKRSNISDDSLVLGIKELQEIQLTYFYEKENKLDEDGFTLFYNCIDYFDAQTDVVYLRKEALECMRDAIDKAPEAYFARFIRKGESTNPQHNTIYPEPFYEQIFGSKKEFESFLNKQSNSPVTIKVKNYWELYRHNNYSSIRFRRQGKIDDIIQDNFTKEIAKLDELKKIDRKLHENGNIATDELRKQLEKNDLFIAYRGKIRDRINEIKV